MSPEQRKAPASWVRDLQARTKGPVEVQLSPDLGVEFPVEVFVENGPGYVRSETLGLSRKLVEELTQWQRWWEDHVDVNGDEVTGGAEAEWQSWSTQGDRLVERLRQELGSTFHVRRV